jgi:fructose 1,6-bisphosphatase
MSTSVASVTVVTLQTHPAWDAAQRRARELKDAMRRHPSFQPGRSAPTHDEGGTAVVREFRAR